MPLVRFAGRGARCCARGWEVGGQCGIAGGVLVMAGKTCGGRRREQRSALRGKDKHVLPIDSQDQRGLAVLVPGFNHCQRSLRPPAVDQKGCQCAERAAHHLYDASHRPHARNHAPPPFRESKPRGAQELFGHGRQKNTPARPRAAQCQRRPARRSAAGSSLRGQAAPQLLPEPRSPLGQWRRGSL